MDKFTHFLRYTAALLLSSHHRFVVHRFVVVVVGNKTNKFYSIAYNESSVFELYQYIIVKSFFEV